MRVVAHFEEVALLFLAQERFQCFTRGDLLGSLGWEAWNG